jgi:membrane dipeptidase
MAAFSAATTLTGLYSFQCTPRKADETAETNRLLTFDLHCHPGQFFWKGVEGYKGDDGVVKTINEMNEGGLTGGFISMVSDMLVLKRTDTGIMPARKFEPGEAWKDMERQLAIITGLMQTLNAHQGLKVSDLTKDESSNVAFYLACEGGDFIEDDLEKVDQIYESGIRSIQLVHYTPNNIGDLQTHDPIHGGLSDIGKEVVRRMNNLGMVIDVAHASFETVKSIAEVTEYPVILSHSILKMEENRPISARAITIEHAKMVAETGGVIGAWPSGFNRNFDEFVENILRLIDVAGIDHVGLGTDMDSNFQPVMNSYLQLPDWIAALKSKGLTEEETAKVAGGNAFRILEAVLKN